MLNNDEPRPAPIHRASVASLINSDEPPAPPPLLPPASAPPATSQDERPPDEAGSQSRKRPRTGDSPAPLSTTSAQRGGSISAASSPVQLTKTVAQSPIQRNNSVIMLHEPLIGLEPSIVNIQPAEELSRFISDFIFLHLLETATTSNASLEVPARLLEGDADILD